MNLTAAAHRIKNTEPDFPIVAIDFEASCLPSWGSYPIEVAASFVTTGAAKSWLIKPTDAWGRTGQWAQEAERLHGLSREMLWQHGLPVDVVRRELRAFVGQRVVSDAAPSDGYWLDVLYDGAPGFAVESVSEALIRAGLCPPAVSLEEIEAARQKASLRFPRRHDAQSDCQRIGEAFRILMQVDICKNRLREAAD
jgi:hypothetical protein